jgi:hypothetical protein
MSRRNSRVIPGMGIVTMAAPTWESSPLDREAVDRILDAPKRAWGAEMHGKDAARLTVAALAAVAVRASAEMGALPPAEDIKAVKELWSRLATMVSGFRNTPAQMFYLKEFEVLSNYVENLEVAPDGNHKDAARRMVYPMLLSAFEAIFQRPVAMTGAGPTARFLDQFNRELSAAVAGHTWVDVNGSSLPNLNWPANQDARYWIENTWAKGRHFASGPQLLKAFQDQLTEDASRGAAGLQVATARHGTKPH